jgi:hypothetical protein
MSRGASDLVDRIKTEIIQSLKAKSRASLKGVELVFLDTQRISIGCRKDSGQCLIEISQGTLDFVQAITDIFLLCINIPGVAEPQQTACYRSAVQIARKYVKSENKTLQLFIGGADKHPLAPYGDELVVAQIVFLLAHELAHVHLAHLDRHIPILGGCLTTKEFGGAEDWSIFLQREREADDLAASWFLDWDRARPLESDLRWAGPHNLLRWIGYCQTMAFALVEEWPGSSRPRFSGRGARPIYSSATGGYDTGSLRAPSFLGAASGISDATAQLIDVNGRMIDLFLAAAQDPDLHARLWKEESPQ